MSNRLPTSPFILHPVMKVSQLRRRSWREALPLEQFRQKRVRMLLFQVGLVPVSLLAPSSCAHNSHSRSEHKPQFYTVERTFQQLLDICSATCHRRGKQQAIEVHTPSPKTLRVPESRSACTKPLRRALNWQDAIEGRATCFTDHACREFTRPLLVPTTTS